MSFTSVIRIHENLRNNTGKVREQGCSRSCRVLPGDAELGLSAHSTAVSAVGEEGVGGRDSAEAAVSSSSSLS